MSNGSDSFFCIIQASLKFSDNLLPVPESLLVHTSGAPESFRLTFAESF